MAIVGATARELLELMQRGEASCVEVTEAHLAAISERDARIAAFLSVEADAALEQARAIDARRRSGDPLGLLGGLPIAVKDVLCTAGRVTTCGSRMLEHFRPPYNAHVIDRLQAADAVVLGKTNLDEFAMGSSTENSAFHTTRNPWDVTRTPGGSSGGSAAAVSAGMCPVAIGTDTGGSIRQPASYCGIVGLKPTYGRVSRYGLVAYASSLDQIGPMASDVQGAARLLQAIAGHDPRDATSVDQPVPDYVSELQSALPELRIGVPQEYFAEGLDDEVRSAVDASLEVYQSLGAEIRPVSLPNALHSVATYYLIAPSEASSNLARYDGVHYGHRAEHFESMIDMYATSRGEAFGDEVKRRIMLGTFALSAGYYDAYYLKALKVRRLIRQDYDRVFGEVDVIAGPTAPAPAFRLGELLDDPLAMYLTDIYTISANLAGLPAISIPAGFSSDGLPIGLQLQGPPFAESQLLRAARMYEQAVDWHTRRPPQ